MVSEEAQADLAKQALAMLGEADLVGVARVDDVRGTPLAESVTSLLPGAKSIVVFGREVFAEVVDLVKPDKVIGEAAARDLYEPHLEYLNGRLNRAIYELATVYRAQGYKVLPLPSLGTPLDSRFFRGVISFKHAAEYAGLGRIGRSSLLITPKFGPRVRLGCLVTDAELKASDRLAEDLCVDCAGVCVAACPSEALSMPGDGQPYQMNKFACASFRAGAGLCTTCLSVCPGGESQG